MNPSNLRVGIPLLKDLRSGDRAIVSGNLFRSDSDHSCEAGCNDALTGRIVCPQSNVLVRFFEHCVHRVSTIFYCVIKYINNTTHEHRMEYNLHPCDIACNILHINITDILQGK